MKIPTYFLFIISFYYGPISAQNTKVYSHVEQMPKFPGGVEAMYKFIYSNMKYPPEARKWGISGQVITGFYVDEKGYLKDIYVVKGPGYGLDEEAMRVVELMNEENRWEPGVHEGKIVPVAYTLPIKFVLR